jgi:peptidyl-tRNA hydrolase, PTH1 family
MILIVGLGNPGEKYNTTPHNAGFMALDLTGKEFAFPEFKFSKKYNSDISEGIISGQKIILAKPQTFMNDSGIAVNKLMGNWKIETQNLLIVHDDIDLPAGKIKISKDSGAGGHKGVESIIENLGSKNFVRIRIGIQPQSGKPEKAEDYVLKKLSGETLEILEKTAKESVRAINIYFQEGLEKAMTEFNK